MSILEKIDSPQDLRRLNKAQLTLLAEEIRALLIQSVSECGGHLASNLGVVELTIALHSVFDTTTDRIIWDVGHQSYVHKILTGRRRQMSTLRQFGGLSGFPKTEESTHDAFNTGHSSTSISAALGMALARDLTGQKFSVIAVIGDGALTGGMAFEALNHAGHQGCDLTVILNDNEMSISRNVGALSGYLNRLRTDPSYSRTKEEIEARLHRIPAIGPNIARAAGRMKEMVKNLVVPGILFEELGFTYIGPVNGHDLDELHLMLSNVKQMKGPVLIHVITQKGRGYEPAILEPDLFHGIGPFNVETGHPLKKPFLTYTEIFGEYMLNRAKTDSRVVGITAAMTSGTGLTSFARHFPERFFDVGICEQHAVTLAAGMAKMGLRPVVAIYSTFLQRAYDQIIHDVALQNLPVIFAIDRAGLVGEDGPTHHGVFDLTYLRSVPNLTVMAPSDKEELIKMLDAAFTLPGPVAIRYPRGVAESHAGSADRLEAGKARLICEGQDIAIMAIGRAVNIAREVVDQLSRLGISAALLDARFAKPLDTASIIQQAKAKPRVVTMEENCLNGGFGSGVLDVLAESAVSADCLRIGIPDEFVEHGKTELLFECLNIDPASIVEAILKRWPELLKKGHELELLKIVKG
ncbi:MAG: 1-deoxy-D-xylulose-5-phosphate synthase [Syntrophomonadaceae bacterium]|nr:1-deoxy-D-xylulose-5-phosphate synthase [Syntrophomonadaceae bacterium]